VTTLNLYAAWVGVLLGIVVGAVQGLFFHRDGWLGGYASWRRRMVRLAHVSLFGLAFVNLAFWVTASSLELGGATVLPSWLFIFGAVTMPACCYLAAFRKGLRHLFVVPVGSVGLGTALLLLALVRA